MKVTKHIIIYEILCLTFAFLIYFEFSFMISGSSVTDNINPVTLNRPQINAQVNLNNQSLVVNERITFTDAVNEAWLNLPANLYADVKINKVGYKDYKVEMLNDNLAMHITFPESMNFIDVEYEVILHEGRSILSYNNNTVLLTQFLMTPAPFIKDKPVLSQRVNLGDPFVYQMHDYEIILNAGSSYSVFAPGQVSVTQQDDKKVYTFKSKSARDFPIALVKNHTIIKKKIRDIDVTYVGLPDVHSEVEKAFAYIEEKTVNYPYKELFLISAPINMQGMELSQMILISDNIMNNRQLMNKVIYHEVFHQWFYGIVGTNQIDEPFMDEGMVCYLVNDMNGKKSDANYKKEKLYINLKDIKSNTDYYNYVYSNGAAFFDSLHQENPQQFNGTLRTVFQKYNGSILTYEDFMDVFMQSDKEIE